MQPGDKVHYIDEFAQLIDVEDNDNVLDSQPAGIHNFAFITRIHNENTFDLEVHRPWETIYKQTISRGNTTNTWHEIEE